MNTCPPIDKNGIETRMTAEFDAWFAKLQELSPEKLDPEDWTARWYDGYTPTDALANGASPPPETREEWISRDDHIAAMEAIRAEYMQRLLGSEQRAVGVTEEEIARAIGRVIPGAGNFRCEQAARAILALPHNPAAPREGE